MTSLDFSPFFRSTVGFDRLFSLLDSVPSLDDASGYPPYDIERVSEDSYRITMAVAGFSQDDLSIESRENTLIVAGARGEADEDRRYLHRGIARRSFKRSFQLADHVKVTGAGLEDGFLHIELEREIPEALKPRKIEITSKPSLVAKAKKVIEGKSKAA